MDGRLGRFLAVAANTFRETVRERVLYNLVLFAVLMTVSGLFLKELSIRQDEKLIKDVGLGAMEIFGNVIAIFIGVGLVAKEIDKRSLYPLVAKPISRGEFYLGKFAGLCFTLAVNVVAMTLGLWATLMLSGRRPDPQLLKAMVPLYVGLVLVVAIALFFSTVTSSLLAAVFTFCMVVAGRYADVIGNMQQVVPGAPGWLVKALYFLLPHLHNLDFKSRVAYGDFVSASDVGLVAFQAVLYAAFVLLAGLLMFRRRELL